MDHPLANDWLRRSACVVTLLLLSPIASATCNNPRNWLESPTQGVKYFVGYELPTNGFGSSTYLDEPERMAYPPLLPKEMWDRSGSGDFLPDEEVSSEGYRTATKGTPVSFFDEDATGNWRLCRIELWTGVKQESSERSRAAANTFFISQQKNSPLFTKWGGSKFGYTANAFLYDAQGRLTQKIKVDATAEGPRTSAPECYRYDDKGSVVLYVDAKVTRACPVGDPDSRDDWTKIRTIWIDGKRLQSRVDRNFSLEAGVAWRRVIGFRSPDGLGPGGTAHANSRTGIEKIVGAAEIGPRDDDNVNVAPKRNGIALKPLEYHFTKPPVPVELIDHLDSIYSYDRRRELAVASAFRWVEWFPAGKTVATNAYLLGGGSVIRHEQRDYAGKLKRAINVAFENFAGRPDALYSEAAITKPLLLKGHEYLYRVWDYGATGAPTLVAIGWNRSLRSKPLDSADVAFGTPDGKIKWKDKEAFFQAVGFDAEARGAHLGATN